ncbi:MAG: acyl-CoA thioesterase [Pseudonocardiales bacterium]|nr:acyl-CoA thioesterase [Pseudonocardiales bacterium]
MSASTESSPPVGGYPTDGKANVEHLLEVLDLERLELDLFRGLSVAGSPPRVFGGQVAAQSLIAAARTVPDGRPPHSFHSYFIRAGDPMIPVVFSVDRVRDGRSFSVRRVIALQNGKGIFALTASFQTPARGLEHGTPMPPVPMPADSRPDRRRRGDSDANEPSFRDSFEMRTSVSSRRRPAGSTEVADSTWFRTAAPLPADPLIHTAMVVFASDFGIMDPVMSHHSRGHGEEGARIASLDHVMWFHHQIRADEWMLFHRGSPNASGARGLAIGEIYNEAGQHCITVAQEAMFRLPEFMD